MLYDLIGDWWVIEIYFCRDRAIPCQSVNKIALQLIGWRSWEKDHMAYVTNPNVSDLQPSIGTFSVFFVQSEHICTPVLIKWKICSEDASTIFEHVLTCRMIVDEEENWPCPFKISNFMYYSVFRRSIPQNFEVYVVTAPRWTASICLERKKEEEFGAPPMKSFHHGAVTTYSSKFWGILLLKTL